MATDERRRLDQIQALRGIAVLAVIAYHLTPESIPFGYLGVDLFLLISGFLITKILSGSEYSDVWSGRHFIMWRFWRLAPALLFTLFLTFSLCLFVLPNENLKSLVPAFLSALFGISNIYFWRLVNYFDPAATSIPVLHSWSLSLEWQFYIGFFVFYTLIKGFNRQWIKTSVLFLTVVSSVCYLILPSIPSFYLLPSRFWQFGLGALVFFWYENHDPKSRLCSLVQIGFFICFFVGLGWFTNSLDDQRVIVSVIFLLLLMGALTVSTNTFRRTPILGLIFLGGISYSLYLVHFPIASFIALFYLGEYWIYSLPVIFLLAIISFFMTEYNYKARFRNKRWRSIFWVLSVSFGLMLSAVFIDSDLGYESQQLAGKPFASLGDKIRTKGDVCISRVQVGKEKFCAFGDLSSEKTVFLLGDSHAQALQWELNTRLAANNLRGLAWFSGNCEVVPGISPLLRPEASSCEGRRSAVLETIEEHGFDWSLIVASRWTNRLVPVPGARETPYRTEDGLVEDGSREIYVAQCGPRRVSAEDWEAKGECVTGFLIRLSESVKKLFIVYPIPELAVNIERWVISSELFVNRPAFPSVSKTSFEQRHRLINHLFDNLVQHSDNIFGVKTAPVLCNEVHDSCSSVSRSTFLYLDDDHLSDAGAKLLLENINFRL